MARDYYSSKNKHKQKPPGRMNPQMLCVFMCFIGRVLTVKLISKTYFKAFNEFRGKQFCDFDYAPRNPQLKMDCLMKCNLVTNCTLTCYNATTCVFYSTLVAPYFDPSAHSPADITKFPDLTCYSSHPVSSEDISGKVIAIEATEEPTFKHLGKLNAIDGYMCYLNDEPFFSDKDLQNPWIQVEFDSVYLIRRVVVYMRDHKNNNPTEFEEIEIRVGLTSGVSGDFSSQELFYYYEGMAADGEILEFVGNIPVEGRFLSIKKVGSAPKLIIDEIKVFI